MSNESIKVIAEETFEDGSAKFTFELSPEATRMFAEHGLQRILIESLTKIEAEAADFDSKTSVALKHFDDDGWEQETE